jgi:hypothetical protein
MNTPRRKANGATILGNVIAILVLGCLAAGLVLALLMPD